MKNNDLIKTHREIYLGYEVIVDVTRLEVGRFRGCWKCPTLGLSVRGCSGSVCNTIEMAINNNMANAEGRLNDITSK